MESKLKSSQVKFEKLAMLVPKNRFEELGAKKKKKRVRLLQFEHVFFFSPIPDIITETNSQRLSSINYLADGECFQPASNCLHGSCSNKLGNKIIDGEGGGGGI